MEFAVHSLLSNIKTICTTCRCWHLFNAFDKCYVFTIFPNRTRKCYGHVCVALKCQGINQTFSLQDRLLSEKRCWKTPDLSFVLCMCLVLEVVFTAELELARQFDGAYFAAGFPYRKPLFAPCSYRRVLVRPSMKKAGTREQHRDI